MVESREQTGGFGFAQVGSQLTNGANRIRFLKVNNPKSRSNLRHIGSNCIGENKLGRRAVVRKESSHLQQRPLGTAAIQVW